VVALLLKIALLVFGFFAVYFFLQAKKTRKKLDKALQVSKKNSFFKGMLLAALNLLTIPYYSGLNAMWNASGWIQFKSRDIATFVVAAGTGTFLVLYLYTVYFYRLESTSNAFSRNSNYILSALMVLLLILTIIRIFYH
jgi:hypothetical protein